MIELGAMATTGPFDPGLPLERVAFAVFDVETTGLRPAFGDRVCEVACLRIEAGGEAARVEALVDPGRPISPGAFAVNGITPAMLRGAPGFGAVAGELMGLMEGAVLVAHNAGFDLGFLASELAIAGLPPPEGPAVDTLTLARRAFSFPRNGLEAVAAALGLDAGPAHRAMGDVWTTYQLLDRLLWELERRWRVTTLGGLLAFQGGPVPYPVRRAIPLPPAIADALELQGQVRLRYVDARGQETQRIIRPLAVNESGGYQYLVAHCYRADALRTFRLDRVVEMALEQG